MEFAGEEQIAHRVLHQLAQRSAQGTCTVLAITALFKQQCARTWHQLDAKAVRSHALVELSHEIIGNVL